MKKRTIREHHNVDIDGMPIYEEVAVPLGLAHPPPRGHTTVQEITEHHEDDVLSLKVNKTLWAIFDKNCKTGGMTS
eukprot:692205-Amphidinium_carterae.1